MDFYVIISFDFLQISIYFDTFLLISINVYGFVWISIDFLNFRRTIGLQNYRTIELMN